MVHEHGRRLENELCKTANPQKMKILAAHEREDVNKGRGDFDGRMGIP
jgi:hypothetical protein